MPQVTKQLLIKGAVQGVGFRYSMVAMAGQKGITGWVRNRRDGSVEAVVQGDERSVKAAVEWAKRGPDIAVVDTVEISDATGDFSEFSIRETA